MDTDIRLNAWLENRLNHLWQTYFSDVPRANEVKIVFGTRAKTRLGSIRKRGNRSLITISGYFRDPVIPVEVIDETISHELIHYTHGFESPLPRLHRYPHEGGVIRREMTKRSLLPLHRAAYRWLKDHWRTYLRKTKR